MEVEMDERASQHSAAPEVAVATPHSVRYEASTPRVAEPHEGAESVTPAKVLRLGSEDTPLEWSCWDWSSLVVEELAFSFFGWCYVLVLLLGSVLFATLLALRLLFAVAVKVYLPSDPHFWGTATMLLAFALSTVLFSSILDMELRLVRSWFALTRDTAHVFYLPNRSYESALTVRNAYLAMLFMAVLVIPFLAGVGAAVQDTALSFFGTASFYSFAATNTILCCVWLFMWWRSLKNKFKVWRRGAAAKRECKDEDEDDQVPWERRMLSNPLVMAEFGLDVLSARMHGVVILLGTAMTLLMVSFMDLSVGDIFWVFVIIVLLVSGLVLSFVAGKPSKKASKVAKHQRYLSYSTGGVLFLFMLLGVTGGAMHGGVVFANVLLLVATQAMTLRRHDLHAWGEWVLPDCDDEGHSFVRCLNVIPCSSVLRLLLPSSCVPRRTRRGKARRAAGDNIVVGHHCEAVEKRYDSTHRVLTADLKITFNLIAALIIAMCIGLSYSDVAQTDIPDTVVIPAVGNVTHDAGYPMCGLSWHGVGASDLGVLTLLAEYEDTVTVDKEAAAAGYTFAGRGNTTEGVVTWFKSPQGTDVVVVGSEGRTMEWVEFLDMWGSLVAVEVFALLNPLVGAWEAGVWRDAVAFLDDVVGTLRGRGRAIPDAVALIESWKLSDKVVVTAYGVSAGKLLSTEAAPYQVVTIAPPMPPTQYPTTTTHLMPDNSLFSYFSPPAHLGFTHPLPCSGTISQCQSLATTVCTILEACAANVQLSVC